MGRKKTEEADDAPDIHHGSTNVYADLGYPDATAMQAKANIVALIASAIKARQLSNEQATALRLTPGELSELLAGRFRAHQIDTLERLASVFDEARR